MLQELIFNCIFRRKRQNNDEQGPPQGGNDISVHQEHSQEEGGYDTSHYSVQCLGKKSGIGPLSGPLPAPYSTPRKMQVVSKEKQEASTISNDMLIPRWLSGADKAWV